MYSKMLAQCCAIRTVLVVEVGAHLVDAVDAVPHRPVEVGPLGQTQVSLLQGESGGTAGSAGRGYLVRGEAVAGVPLDAGHKLRPGLGEQHAAKHRIQL